MRANGGNHSPSLFYRQAKSQVWPLAHLLFSEAVHHLGRICADRGGQYCGHAYRALLHEQGALRPALAEPPSRRGDCYDNAQAENPLKGLGASAPAAKRRCSNGVSDPFLLTWPTRKPASPTILSTIITTDSTAALATRRRISLPSNFFKLLSKTLQPNWTTSSAPLARADGTALQMFQSGFRCLTPAIHHPLPGNSPRPG